MDIVTAAAQARRVVDAVEKAILGKRQMVLSAVATVLSDGHLLIEDIPGVGKTTLAKALAHALGCDFKRIQFTPDLLPSDVTGSSIFNQKTTEFEFRGGPVFANIVLADEVNRTTPKTQSALLECMEERQVTVDGVTRSLPSPFFVIATQNNVEMSGTYPLPEAQLDRFTARLSIGYPRREDELLILQAQVKDRPVDRIEPVMDAPEVVRLQRAVRDVHIAPELQQYIVDVVAATRTHPAVSLAASPRASLALQHVSQAVALMAGRDYVTPDDIKALAVAVLAHRVVIRPEQRMKGLTAQSVVNEILQRMPVPLGVR